MLALGRHLIRDRERGRRGGPRSERDRSRYVGRILVLDCQSRRCLARHLEPLYCVPAAAQIERSGRDSNYVAVTDGKQN